jgi:hypothetical protein
MTAVPARPAMSHRRIAVYVGVLFIVQMLTFMAGSALVAA